MHKTVALVLAAALLSGSGAASAKPMHHKHMAKAMSQPKEVTIDGKAYPVCTATMQDGCINPREAGLKYGNTPLNNWPGHPASEKPAM
jgi:hypothetical protein